jgi:hypothetical protein
MRGSGGHNYAEFLSPKPMPPQGISAALGIIGRSAYFSLWRYRHRLKNPGDLTEAQAETLAEMKRTGGILWRAYQLKEALRGVFAGDLDPGTVDRHWTAGAPARSAAASPSSSRPAARSANTAPGSTPRSAGACPTAATKASTTRSG